jgi:hypothetical protein
MQRQCGIWFLSSSRPFEFCIHNADRDTAVCYLRRPFDRRFVDWCRGEKAIEIVKDVNSSLASSSDTDEEYSVFRPSLDFNLLSPENANKRKALEKEVKILFDEEIHDRVLGLCFGRSPNKTSPTQTGRSKRPK